jgi:hypothetical protein
MTGAVLDRPGSLFEGVATPPDPGRRPECPAPPFGGRLTLEERLDAALHETRTNGSTECPACHARMTSSRDGAACGSCGSRLG